MPNSNITKRQNEKESTAVAASSQSKLSIMSLIALNKSIVLQNYAN